MVGYRVRLAAVALVAALVALPMGQSLAQSGRGVVVRSSPRAATTQMYHFTSSLVAATGAQVSHIDGILTLTTAANGSLQGSSLRLTTGSTVQVTGNYTRTLEIAMSVNGMDVTGSSTAISGNRISGIFTKGGGTIGFWVATAIAPNRAGTKFMLAAKITSGPDAGTTYDGTLQLFGDKFGGLVGFLALKDGSVLRVNGQDVNGNVNMVIIVRAGTPLFISGTTVLGGNFRGSTVGPLAGDEGHWTASTM
ncbi:MAG: hypothetical protein NVSMB65_19590 [Chloroflexota bacterium]